MPGDHEPNSTRSLLILTTAAFALSSFDRHILNITLNDIGVEFQLSDLQLGSLSGIAFALVYALLGFPIAKLSIAGRRKRILVVSLGLWSLMTAFMGLASSYVQIFLARMGVGIGEAGCVPPSHSMISDAYRAEKRATALAVFSAGTNLGVFLSFIIGGFVTAHYGWRVAFIVAGIPGIILAMVIALRLREPIGNSETKQANSANYRELVMELLGNSAVRHVLIGATLSSIVGYGALTWLATFLIRTHGLELGQIGLYLAIVLGIFGALGTWLGGYCSDRLGLKRPDWRLKFIAATILVAKPLAILFYLTDMTVPALIIFILPASISAMFVGPSIAFIYSEIEPHKRPMTSALIMFMFNLIGLGIGPTCVGLISDILSSNLGADSLRYALISIQIAGLWAALHYWLAGTYVLRRSTPSRLPA